MFCMYCGQSLPEGARFCMQCGTPQGTVSPTGTTQAETINLDGSRSFVPAMCPNCNSHMEVDPSSKIARCNSCGTECLVQDAIKTLSVKGNVNVGNASICVDGADSVTINAGGTNIDSLLQRVEIMLEDGDYNGVIDKCNTILDLDHSNGRAYFFLLLAEYKCRSIHELENRHELFDINSNYQRAIQFGDEELKAELFNCLDRIRNYNSVLHKGDTFQFGTISRRFSSYFFDEGVPMKWEVLCVDGSAVFLVSEKPYIDTGYYYTGVQYSELSTHTNNHVWVSWKDSYPRKLLNNDFYHSCFTVQEREKILWCTSDGKCTPRSHNEDERIKSFRKPGTASSSINDKITLLSPEDIEFYYPDRELRKARFGPCWLRGDNQDRAYFLSKGHVDKELPYSDYSWGLYPALWLKL